MSDKNSSLQVLMDKQALHDLVMTYCRAIDRRDFTLLGSLYHDGAIEDRGAIFCGLASAFIAWIADEGGAYEATVHRIFNTLFIVDGDKAQGEIYAEAYHRTAGDDPMEIVAGGRYLDCYERHEGQWKIVHRTATVDRCSMNPVNQEAYSQFVAGSIVGQPNKEDLSYQALSLFSSL